MNATTPRFRAFISYSQRDAAATRRLHRSLEAYRVPVGLSGDLQLAKGRRLGRFFRDEDDMAATADIAGLVRGAIEDSASLIVMCSPNSARSHWVNAEIEHYRKTERSNRVFAVILSGQPNSGDPETECFPPALRVAGNSDDPNAMPVEPLALDVRKQSKARLLARLAAGLMGIDFDTLWKRDRRRALFLGVRTAAIALAASTSIALAIAWGIREQGRAASRDLAQASLAESAAGRYDRALRLAILANRQSLFQPAAQEAYPALVRAATGVRTITELRGHEGEVLSAAFSPDGRLVATSGRDGLVRVWDIATSRQISTFSGHVDDPGTSGGSSGLGQNDAEVYSIVFSPDSTRVLTAGMENMGTLAQRLAASETVDLERGRARVWVAATGEELFSAPVCAGWEWEEPTVIPAQIQHRDDVIISESVDCRLIVSASDGAPLEEAAAEEAFNRFFTIRAAGLPAGENDEFDPQLLRPDREIDSPLLRPDGERHVVSADAIDYFQTRPSDFEPVLAGKLVGHTGLVNTIAYDLTLGRLVSTSVDGSARVWRVHDDLHPVDVHRWPDLGVDGRTEAATWLKGPGEPPPDLPPHLVGAGLWSLVDPLTGKEIAQLNGEGGHSGRIWSAAFRRDGRLLVTAGEDETARIWDRRSGEQRLTLVGHTASLRSADFSPDGSLIATSSDDGTARLWDVETGLEVDRIMIATGHPSRPLAPSVEIAGDELRVCAGDACFRDVARAIPAALRSRIGIPTLTDEVCDDTKGDLQGALRRLTGADTAAVAALAGRAGEDVCAWQPAWYDRLVDTVLP